MQGVHHLTLPQACRSSEDATAADLLLQPELLPPDTDIGALRAALPSATNGAAHRPQAGVQAAALREIQRAAPAAHGGRRQQQPALSPAALLNQARTPSDVAAVFSSMPEDHQRLRVRMWAALSVSELAALETLSSESKECIKKARCKTVAAHVTYVLCIARTQLPTPTSSWRCSTGYAVCVAAC